MKKRSKRGKILLTTGILLVAAVFACAGFFIFHQKQSGSEADEVIKQLEIIIPGLGQELEYSQGMGRDPLIAYSAGDIDVVGVLQIPSLNLMAPVADKKEEKPAFATWVSGSPVKGKFRLTGGRTDVFVDLTKVKPADKIIFTDIDGVQYHYEVTTQLHLKNWDDADYDLMLCYDTDDQTQFVVGCTRQ